MSNRLHLTPKLSLELIQGCHSSEVYEEWFRAARASKRQVKVIDDYVQVRTGRTYRLGWDRVNIIPVPYSNDHTNIPMPEVYYHHIARAELLDELIPDSEPELFGDWTRE